MGRRPDPLTEDVRRLFFDEGKGVDEVAKVIDLAEFRVWKIITRIRKKMSRERIARGERIRRQRVSAGLIKGGPDILPDTLIEDRTPCFNCEVRADKHAEFGCKSWRPRP